MTLLGKIIREILTEDVSMGDVSAAIDNHETIVLNYHSQGKDEHSGPRVIEPYALGLTKAGNPVLRAFEVSGDSRSGISPGWKFMRLDRISSWEPTGETFNIPASERFRGLGDFNPDNDRSMSVVYKIAKFGNEEEANVPQGGPKTKDGKPYQSETQQGTEQSTERPSSPTTTSNIKLQNAFQNNDNAEKSVSGPRMKDGSVDIYKTDTEKNMSNLRKQLEHPIYTSDLKYNNQPTTNPLPQEEPSEEELNSLRDRLGDTSEPMTFADLRNRLNGTSEEDVENEEEKQNI